MSEANLTNANLSEANLHEALVIETQLSAARRLASMIMPDGTKRPDDADADDRPGGKRKPNVNRLAEAAERLRKQAKE